MTRQAPSQPHTNIGPLTTRGQSGDSHQSMDCRQHFWPSCDGDSYQPQSDINCGPIVKEAATNLWIADNTFGPIVKETIRVPGPSETKTGWIWLSLVLYGIRLPLGQWGACQELKLICSSLLYGTRLRLGQWGARQKFCSKLMLWKADLLLALVWDETASRTVRSNTKVLLLTVPEHNCLYLTI